MDEAQIAVLVDRLDELAPREGARVRLEQHGGGPAESRIVANQAGYLRFGVELLKAAFAPLSPMIRISVLTGWNAAKT